MEYIAHDAASRPLHVNREVSRVELVDLIDDLLERTVTCIDNALADADLQPGDIDRVLLVGGSTRIPAVWDSVSEFMGQEPHGEIDPDAAVALGAAVQAGIIAGDTIDTVLVDVTPLSLGIETASLSMSGHLQFDRFTPLIRRNTTVPVHKSEVFSTLYPGQTEIHVKVYQGEDPVASNNVQLGDFRVEALQPNRADGLADVTVNFALDLNGILHVTVTERATGRQVSEQLKADRQRLSPEQINASRAKLGLTPDSAVTAVELDAELDPGTKALVERAQRALEQDGVDADLATQLQETIEQLHEAGADGDANRIEVLSNALIDLLFEAES